MSVQLGLLIVCVVGMALTWLYQRRVNNAGWVDVVWAGLLGGLAIAHAYLANGSDMVRWATAIMGGFWGLRLTWHLAVRVSSEAEDGRYKAMREHWGEQQQSKLFWFYIAQAIIAWLFGWVFWATANNMQASNLWIIVGLSMGFASIIGESIADRQLARFKHRADSKGKTCRDGLWRYSRHPNYFFEWLHWCSYPLLAIGSGYWWVALLGPVIMLLFLYRVTGIPYTEKQALKSRGEDYREYQRTTSAFFPWPPKN